MRQKIDKNNKFASILNDYKKQFPIDTLKLEDAIDFVKGKTYLITVKVDGELSIIHYNKKDDLCEIISKNGRVRTEFPLTDELRSYLSNKNINELLCVGELYVKNEDGSVMNYPNAISVLRNPKNIKNEQRINLMIFDIIEIDKQNFLKDNIISRINYLKKFFQNGIYYSTVEIYKTDNIRVAYNDVLKDESKEGLVIILDDNTRFKVKPVITIELVVVGVEISEKNPSLMGSLKLSYINEEGLFIFDSSVGTGFSNEDRREWLLWAEENEVIRDKNIIYVDPFEDPRIVEVNVRGISLSEGPGMKFDRKLKKWLYVDDYVVGTLRQPSFSRLRDDKDISYEDLRLSQVIPSKFVKKNSIEDYNIILKDKYTIISSKEKKLIQKLAKIFQEEINSDDLDNFSITLNTDNNLGFRPGDRVISLTKDILGTIIGYEQVFCPKCNIETVCLPTFDMPKLTITFVCSECGYYMERTDVDYRVLWDKPIDGGNLMASEVHPTEIKKAWILNSGITPGTENDIVIQPNEYYKNGLTKKDIYEYYNRIKDQLLNFKGDEIFVIIGTDEGVVLKRHKNGFIKLDEKTFSELNTGRTIEFHRVISDDTTKYGWIDIDPRENVDFNDVKQLVKDLYEYLNETNIYKNIKIYFSGNRGFYIIFDLIKPMPVNELRNNLIILLEEFIEDYKYDMVTTGITRDPNTIRLDVSTLKKTGSIKMLGSISYKTGLVVKEVSLKDLDSFEKEDAKIYMEKKSFKNIRIKDLIGYEGRFVIQEHFSDKHKKTHFDLRFEIPISSVNGG